MKTISIIGATISGNRGAEAMLSSVIGVISEQNPNTRFNIYSYYPQDDRKLCHKENIKIFSATPFYLVFVLFPFSIVLGLLTFIRFGFFRSLFPRSVIALKNSDALIDISGVSFMDGRAVFIPFNILTIFPAMLLQTPVVKFSQALGTFKNPVVRFSSKLFLPGCKKIFARGEKTKINLSQINLEKEIIDDAADLAFLYKLDYSLSNENQAYLGTMTDKIENIKKAGKLFIGICPSAVIATKARKENWNYPMLLADIVKKLTSQGFAVLLFPNATREKNKKLRNNDLPVIEKTARYLAAFNEYPDDLLIITQDINTAGIKKLMGYCDLTVVSRFHAMIASLTLSTPVIVMGWGHKYQEVMDQFGLGKFVFDYKTNDTSLLVEKVISALESNLRLQEQISQTLPAAKQSAYKQFVFLFNMIDK